MELQKKLKQKEKVMKQRTNTNRIFLFALIALVAFSVNIFGQGYWCNDSNYGMNWWNNDLPSNYQLTTEQVSEMNEYRGEYDEKIVPLQKELRLLQIEMRGYNRYNNDDLSKIEDTRSEIRKIQDEIADLRIEARKNMSGLLSENQQTYLNNSDGSWWNGFYSRCGWDYEDMTYNYGYGSRENRTNMRRGCW